MLLIWALSGSFSKKSKVVAWEGLPYTTYDAGVPAVRHLSFVNNIEYMFVITSDALPESQDFAVTMPAALTTAEAAALAKGSLDRYLSVDEQNSWRIVNVALKHLAGTKWYYTVSFKPETGGMSSNGSINELCIPLLMDNTVVKGVHRQSAQSSEKNLENAAKALGLTPDELALRKHESVERAQGNYDVTLISHVDSAVYKFEIPKEQLLQQEDCDLTQPLPLAFHEAAAIALQCSRSYLPAGQGMSWHIKELSLNRWGNSGKWYYLVGFRVQGAEHGVVAPLLQIPVLLDGKAVQGQPVKLRGLLE